MATHLSDTPPGSNPSREEAPPPLSDVAAQVKSSAEGVMQDARAEVRDRADAARSSVADEVTGVAQALRTAARQMRGGSPQERTFRQIAESLADASDAVRDKDLSELAREASDFARRNPLVFLSGAALVGFAAARFAKSSRPDADGSASRTKGGAA